MKIPVWRSALVCAAVFASGAAFAESSDAPMVEIQTMMQKGYDPSDHADTLISVRLIPDRQITGRCSLDHLTLHPEVGNSFSFTNGFQSLSASAGNSPLIRESAPAEIRFNPSVANRLCAGVPVDLELLKVRSKQFVPADLYIANVVLRSGQTDVSNAQIDMTVLPSVILANGTSNLREALVFPAATTGASVRTSFAYLANTHVTLSAFSDNAGRLRNESDLVEAYLPYSLRLNGEPVELHGAAEITMLPRTTGPTFVDVHFQIGAVTGPLWTGKYTDVVTITLSAF